MVSQLVQRRNKDTKYEWISNIGIIKWHIEKTRRELNELTQNPTSLEKFAREKYFFKQDDEDLFILSDK